jgi:hypothetical protein
MGSTLGADERGDTKMATKLYKVEATLKFSCYYHSGYSFEIPASNKAEAIKIARKKAWYEGHTRQDGPLTYRATELAA